MTLLAQLSENSCEITPLLTEQFSAWMDQADERVANWARVNQFAGKAGQLLLLPSNEGSLAKVVVVCQDGSDFWSLGGLPERLPAGDYHIAADAVVVESFAHHVAVAWLLGQYRFQMYRSSNVVDLRDRRLHLLGFSDLTSAEVMASAWNRGRDWINMPAEDMNPQYLAELCTQIADQQGADCDVIADPQVLKEHFPAVHAVGRAGVIAPRVIDLRWQSGEGFPKLTLVGKGVCFDTGGLNLKPSRGIRHMKKDMAGAAHALVLAKLIMAYRLPIELRVLICAVENAIGPGSYRPGDIVKTRAGLFVEIDNTDAEGRMIMCDALTAAVEESPDLLINFSTLTGAARVALGADIPAVFSNHPALAQAIAQCSESEGDPVWPMPLHQPYKSQLDSECADMVNCSSSGYGGAITAGLYLQAFVPATQQWVHYDLCARNESNRPGRPQGGELFAVRGLLHYLRTQFIA